MKHLHCTTPALAGGARERSAVQVWQLEAASAVAGGGGGLGVEIDVAGLAPRRGCSPAPLVLPSRAGVPIRG